MAHMGETDTHTDRLKDKRGEPRTFEEVEIQIVRQKGRGWRAEVL
jgi:hypothetical protein